MIKAGSLLYAIYICLLISILTGALILIFNFKLDFSSKQLIKNKLINQCDSCIKYYLSFYDDKESIRGNTIDIFDDGIQCNFTEYKWGLHTLLTTKAYFKKDTIKKNTLTSTIRNKENTAFYLCDWGEELKVSGTTSIKGNLMLPNRKYKTINLLGNSQINKPEISGNIFPSKQDLPPLSFTGQKKEKEKKILSFSDIKKESFIYNDFSKSTLLIELKEGDKIDHIKLKGNIILKSSDTLYINNSTEIEDIIIKAPKIVFQSGFTGNAQIFASNEVILEKNVILMYPSNIIVSSLNNLRQKKITLEKNAQVHGVIVLEAKSFDEKETNSITLGEEVLVVGDIYCNGILQLQGEINGSVYTHKLKLETKSGTYQNTILNGKIDVKQIYENYTHLPVTLSASEETYGIIKKL